MHQEAEPVRVASPIVATSGRSVHNVSVIQKALMRETFLMKNEKDAFWVNQKALITSGNGYDTSLKRTNGSMILLLF